MVRELSVPKFSASVGNSNPDNLFLNSGNTSMHRFTNECLKATIKQRIQPFSSADEGSDGYGSQNGFAPTSSNATNNGIIYVKGNDTQNTSVIGMSAGYIQGFTATNNGEIWVDGGTSAQSSAIAVTPDNKAVNTGDIYVKNGYGILHLPEEYDDNPTKTVAIENSGTINVEGEGSYAIYTNAQQASEEGTFEGATQQVLVTNSGTIEATSGASAIKATGNDVHVTLEGQSKVVGAVELGENTDLTVALANDNNNTQLELVGEKIRNVTLKDSTLEFTGNQSTYEFASLSTIGDSQIRLIGNDRTLKVNDLNGSVSLYSDHVSEGSTPVFAVDGIGTGDQLSAASQPPMIPAIMLLTRASLLKQSQRGK